MYIKVLYIYGCFINISFKLSRFDPKIFNTLFAFVIRKLRKNCLYFQSIFFSLDFFAD